MRPHRRQPTRLCRPWDSFSRQEHWSGLPFPSPMCESEVVQSFKTLIDPMDCSLPGSSIHGIFQARVLEWLAIAFSVFRLSRGIFLSLHGQARSTNYCFLCVQRACSRDHELTELPGQDVGLMPLLFYCLGVCLLPLLRGCVAKQTCFLE